MLIKGKATYVQGISQRSETTWKISHFSCTRLDSSRPRSRSLVLSLVYHLLQVKSEETLAEMSAYVQAN